MPKLHEEFKQLHGNSRFDPNIADIGIKVLLAIFVAILVMLPVILHYFKEV